MSEIEYTIEINPIQSYAIEMNEQGPQGATGPKGDRGYTGNGIESYVKTSTVGLTDIYTITFTDGNTTTVGVENGRGISSIGLTSSVGNIDTYTITYNDNTTSTFNVVNGIDGQSAEIVSATASIDSNIGTPGIDLTVGGTPLARTFNFAFHNLKGVKGDKGNIGPQGETGPQGPQGIRGETGPQGDQGLQGERGPKGDTGETGPQGEQGPTGPQGPKGDTGNTGPAGNGISSITKTSTAGLIDTYTITYTNSNTDTFTVTNGQDGTDGTNGFSPTATVSKSGDTAIISITDINGTTTANITDGADGTAATISVGTVTTGTAGSSASVVNSGTSNAAVFDFAIPKGDKGDTGNTGATGNGIDNISLISTVGLQKTYRITYTNGTYYDYVVTDGASGSAQWGGITGTLSNQTDLQNELDNKYDVSNPKGYVTTNTLTMLLQGKQNILVAGNNITLTDTTVNVWSEPQENYDTYSDYGTLRAVIHNLAQYDSYFMLFSSGYLGIYIDNSFDDFLDCTALRTASNDWKDLATDYTNGGIPSQFSHLYALSGNGIVAYTDLESFFHVPGGYWTVKNTGFSDFSTYGSWNCILYNPNEWSIVIFSSKGYMSKSIDNGNTWSTPELIDPLGTGWLTYVAYGNNYYVSFYDTGSSVMSSVSSDGVNWDTPIQHSSITYEGSAYTFDILSGKFIIFNYRDGIFLESIDGTNWTQSTEQFSTHFFGLQKIAYAMLPDVSTSAVAISRGNTANYVMPRNLLPATIISYSP